MELDHEFTVATDADTAWPVLLDVERMHPLMPGVTYESGADGEYRGRLKLKFGPTTITYRGTVRLAVVDDLTRTAILEVSAREARGQGTVTGSFQAVVLPGEAAAARVALHTRLTFTGGRAASLGDHLVHDTGARLLTRFAANLNTLLTTPTPEPAPTKPTDPPIPAEAKAAQTELAEPDTLAEAVSSPTEAVETAAPAEAKAAEATALAMPPEPGAAVETVASPTKITETATPVEAEAAPSAEAAQMEHAEAAASTMPMEPDTLAEAVSSLVEAVETAAQAEVASGVEAAQTEHAETAASAMPMEPDALAETGTLPVEVASGVEAGRAGLAGGVALGVPVEAAGRGEGDALELYELTERAGRLRRVLPLAGVLVLVVLVVRRLVRRR